MRYWMKGLILSLAFAHIAFAQGDGDEYAPPRFAPPPSPGVINANPKWSAGIQIGHSIGFSMQRVGFFNNILDLGLGFVPFHVTGDYMMAFDQDFRHMVLGPGADVRSLRGQILFCFGGGVEFGHGMSLRVPAKVEYILPRDPFAFFFGLVMLFGPFMNSDDDPELNLDWMAGARVLL